MRIAIPNIVSAGVFTAIVLCAATFGYVSGVAAQPQGMPKALSGDDIQFQVTGVKHRGSAIGDSVEGVLMVRVNGKWMVAQVKDDLIPPSGVKPLE
jgi:hypothetical protein